MREQRVHERAGPVSLGRVNDEPRLLREHDHVVVLVADVERDGLRDEVATVVRRYLDLDALPRLDRVLLGRVRPVYQHEPVLDELGGRRARCDELQTAEQRVESHAGLIGRDEVLEVADGHDVAPGSAGGLRQRLGLVGGVSSVIIFGREQNPQREDCDTADDGHVGDVEHGEVDEGELEEVRDEAQSRSVDEVAEGSRRDQSQARSPRAIPEVWRGASTLRRRRARSMTSR